MSTATVVEKPLCRGRGIGIGWIGKYKPKPCRVTKDDIVSLPQSFTDADKDSVPRKPALLPQTSVENLSERIARDILGAQTEDSIDSKKEVVSTTIDLTGDDDDDEIQGLDNSGDSSRSWIDSIDSTLGAQEAISNKKLINETDVKKYNTNLEITTESVMKAYTDICHESPNTSPRQFVSLCTLENEKTSNLDDKGISTGSNVECDLEEKPEHLLCDTISRLNLSSDSNDSITDEINASKKHSDIRDAAGHKDIFMKAVYAEEFVPSWCVQIGTQEEERNIQNNEAYIVEDERNTIEGNTYIPADERNVIEDEGSNAEQKSTVYPYSGPQPFEGVSEATIVLAVLDDVILTLMDDPGDFDNVIEQLTDHLVNFVTQEDTLKQVVDSIIGKAIEEPNFSFMAAKLSQHFDERKAIELENGITFRKVFFARCQEEFKALKNMCKDAESCKENNKQITRTTLLFGELLCTMKIKDKVLPLYREKIEIVIGIFLDIGSEETIVILTTLLKLVGPELDKNRPKDVEALFDKVKDFYLDSSKSRQLPKSVKTNLWNVYKLHSRDWDRATSPLDSPSLSREPKFFAKSEHSGAANRLERQKSNEKSSTRSSPIDWDEYYDGDDLDLYQNYMDRSAQADEECDAFEEFLRMSGQV